MRRVPLLVLLVSLALPATASAHRAAHAPPKSGLGVPAIFALALKDAEEYWGGPPPCHGVVAFEPGTFPGESSVWAAAMWSTWHDLATYQRPGEPGPVTRDWLWWEAPWVDAANFTECVIGYSTVVWPTEQSFITRWPEYAENIAHEVEHLENRWSVEPEVDHGPLSECVIPLTAVNFPYFDGLNEPWPAIRHRPPGASARPQHPRDYGKPACATARASALR